MKRIFKLIILFFFIMIIFISLFETYALLHRLDLNQIHNNINIYDRYGNIIYQSNPYNSSSFTNIKDINQDVIDVFVNIEDKRFYYHNGFDPLRFIKACLVNIKSQSIKEGGSTITQQYAKNLFLNNEQSFLRKIKELTYAKRLEMQYSKKDILEGYLNTLYFGHGIYGISDASSFFFQKPLNKLSLKQICSLAAIPNGPTLYSPINSMNNNEKRSNLILEVLKNNKVISDKEYLLAKKEKIKLNVDYGQEKYHEYYVDGVLNELKQLNIDTNKNLDVYTYFDPFIQKQLAKAIQNNIKKDDPLQSSAIVSIPFNGNIVALMGGKDYSTSQYNRALYSKRQIASTIKPLLYYCALKNGFSPDTLFLSTKTTFYLDNNEAYNPGNYDDQYPNQNISMIHALSLSDNIYAIKTHLFLGTNVLADELALFDIEAPKVASLALGSVSTSLKQLSDIYHCFASEGLQVKQSFINQVKSNQKIIYHRDIKPKQLLSRDEVLLMSQMLTSPFDEKNIDKHAIPTMLGYACKSQMAAKSGTSDWDSYVMSYNPQYVIGIWCGMDNNELLPSKHYATSKKIYKQLCNALYPRDSNLWYQPSDNIDIKCISPINGNLDDNGSVYWFKKGSNP